MTSKHIRLIALLLAASLFLNMVPLPAQAEEIEETTVVTEAPTEAPT